MVKSVYGIFVPLIFVLPIFKNHVVPKQASMSRRCIMPNKALLPLRWNTSLFVKISVNVKGSMHVNTRGKTLVRIT
ncbi:hypothetical protein D3C71_1259400 [compost metagenome]